MRVLLSAALTCCAIVGLSNASEAQAVMRKATNIPPQALRPALHLLSQEREVQVVFRTDIVADLRTSGASGELTVDEALNQLLSGTGLTYRYLDDHTVTVIPSYSIAPLSPVKPTEGVGETAAQQGFWNRLRLSQTTQSPERSAGVPRKDAASSAIPGAEGSQDAMEEIKVIAAPYRFLDADTSGTTNLPLPIEKVPQSITLLSADFMEAAGIRKAENLDDYVAGMSDAGELTSSLGSVSRQYIRGFRTGFFYSRYIDGLPVPEYNPEHAFIDRVEIVKGPSSVTYGIATPGGLYNFVPKRAPKSPSARFSTEAGSWNSYQIEAEGGGPLNDAGSLRATAAMLYDAGDSFVHHIDHENSAGYAALEYSGEGKVSGALHATFTKSSITGYDGLLLFYPDASQADVPRSFFMGDPDRNRIHQKSTLLDGHLDFAATEQLSFKAKTSYLDQPTDGYLAYTSGPLAYDGTYHMAGQITDRIMRAYSGSLSGLWQFPAFGREGSFLSAAATYIHYETSTELAQPDYHGSGNTTVNLSEGEAGLYSKVRQWTQSTTPPTLSTLETEIKLLSMQSLIRVTDRVSVLAGSSISSPAQRNQVLPAPAVTADFDHQTSLRGGLTYEFRQNSNAYVSFSESFEPQTLRDENRNLLPPLEGSQWEVGVKSRQRNGQLLLTAAAFRLEETNDPNYVGFDPNVGQIYRANGKVRHQGLELEATGLVTPSVTIMAAATYLDAKIIEDLNPARVGTRRTFLPRHTASLFAVKGFDGGPLRGFNVGGGIRYTGNLPTTFDGSTLEVDAHTVIDLIAGYRSTRWSTQLSLNNILDEFYVQGNGYQSIHKVTVGEPRNVRLRISWDFGGTRH